METNKSIPKPKSRLLLFLLTALISVTTILSIKSPLTVYADANVDVEAEHSDGVVGQSSDSKWYSTYAKGAGYKGQGVLIYLLEREGGGPVAGTSPKAYPCSAEVKGYELHAQDKYNRYGEVTTWESTTPPWGGPNSGGIMNGSVYSNVDSIKAWLKTPHGGDSTQGIQMVYDIWGSDVADRFVEEEIILIVEPIVAVQYSQYVESVYLQVDPSMTIAQMLQKLKNFKAIMSSESYSDTGISADLLDFIDTMLYFYDSESAKFAYNNSPAVYNSMKANLYNLIASKSYNTNTYWKLGDPVAGTAKMLIKYYNDLTPTRGTKAESGRLYYRRSAQRAAYVTSSTRICDRANFDLWPAGTSASMIHNDDNINSKSIGMLAMLAFSDDGGQTTCDEPQQPDPHIPPEESQGTCTIIKSYREIMPEGHKEHRGTHHRSGVANNITIEDESEYKVIGWKTSTSVNLTINSLTWESSVPAIIGDTGTSPTTVTLPDTHKYLYVLLEKGDPEPLDDANYVLTQSTIARHIRLNNPDNRTVGNTEMRLLKDVTFKWVLPAFSNDCPGHSCVPVTGGCKCGGHTHSHTASNCSKSVDPSKCSKTEHKICTLTF
uniref:hypothetical protein n=1 Tax=Acetatifactor sp. TaxID=1872090 RepID=UPI0040579A51